MSQLTQPSPQETPFLPLSLLHLRQRLLRLRSRPALSTAVAMSRAMAMTALINKLTSAPLCFLECSIQVHESGAVNG